MYILIAILLIVVLVFGVASGMQSHATAKQAQAQIEVAQVAQVNAWGNLIVILILALVIVCALALVIWMVYSRQRVAPSRQRPTIGSQEIDAQPTNLEKLIQLETLRYLRSFSPPSSNSQDILNDGQGLPAPTQRDEEELYWLRQ